MVRSMKIKVSYIVFLWHESLQKKFCSMTIKAPYKVLFMALNFQYIVRSMPTQVLCLCL